jgi:predicted nucleic acid-binding protein
VLACDASLIVELSLDRIGEDARAALGDAELVAAPLLWSEVPSVLHEIAFRGEISRALGERALKRFLEARIGIAERRPVGLAMTAWRLADELGWAKTYDAEYVALAELVGCRLVTLDTRLRRGAERLGFVLTPTELVEDADEVDGT